MKKIIFIFCIMLVGLLSLVSCGSEKKYDIVVTNIIGYEAARAVLEGNTQNADSKNENIKMLLKPGSDIHSYQPSAIDKRAIYNAKLFIYVGGESDSEWVSDLLASNKNENIKIVSMFEVLKDRLILEDGEEDEYDEHVWTDPENYCLVVKAIRDALIEIDSDNKNTYTNNVERYIEQVNIIDNNYKTVIRDYAIKNTIVVADRNPFRYMAKHYGINIVGALEGCSSDKNVPISKVIELKNVVEESKLNTVFTIELSEGAIAESVVKEVEKDHNNGNYDGPTPVRIKTLYSMQSITEEDYKKGMTYILMLTYNWHVVWRTLESNSVLS